MVKGRSSSRVLQENTKSCRQSIKQEGHFHLILIKDIVMAFPAMKMFFLSSCVWCSSILCLVSFSFSLVSTFIRYHTQKQKKKILNQGQNWTTTCTCLSAIIITVFGSLEIKILMFTDFFETPVCLYYTSTCMYELADNKYCILSIKHHR